MQPHILPRRLWDYINFKTEITTEEEVHISDCPRCLYVFKMCVLAESPDQIYLEDPNQKRSA